MNALEDKVAIITGASSGIGLAAAKLFAAEGANLVVAARRGDRLDALVDEIASHGGTAIAVAGDVREEAHARTLAETAVSEFGGLDIAFNNAGASGAMGPLPEVTLEGWTDTLDVNLTSAFLCAHYQLPAMLERGGGVMVFTSSFVGNSVGFPGMAAYAAAKAGLCGLVRALAVEYGARGIRANALLPGGVDTPGNNANAPGAGPEVRDFIESLHALKRMATAEEMAKAALFLASDASSFVTGTGMFADGGVSITRT